MRIHSKSVLVAAFVVALAHPIFPAAAAQVAPNVVFINPGERGAQITVHNPGAVPIEVDVTVAFGYEEAGDNDVVGTIYPSEGEKHSRSAAAWLRVYPQRVMVGPGTRQTVRLFSRPPANLPDGEYWARMQVQTRPATAISDTIEDEEVRVRIGVTTRQRIPVFVRVGDSTASLRISEARIIWCGKEHVLAPSISETDSTNESAATEDSSTDELSPSAASEMTCENGDPGAGRLVVRYRADLEGNGAFLGTMKARLLSSEEEIARHEAPVAFFTPGWRRLTVPLGQDVSMSDLSGMKLVLETAREHPVIQSRYLLPGEPDRYDGTLPGK